MPLSGFDLVRIILGLLLLAAGILKAHQFLTAPVLQDSFFESRWLQILLIQFEFLFGLWMLSGLYVFVMRVAAILCFCTFALLSLAQAIGGDESCGCFGALVVHPWHTFLIDVTGVLTLLLCRPKNALDGRERNVARGRIATLLVLYSVVGLATAYTIVNHWPEETDDEGVLIVAGRTVLLNPQHWVRKKFPLLKYIDIGEELAEGQWLVVIYRHDCPHCQDLLESKHLRGGVGSPGTKIALIEISTFTRAKAIPDRLLRFPVHGRLSEQYDWISQVPTTINLVDGIVTAVHGA